MLAEVITTDMVSGLFSEMYAVMPVILPAAVGYMGIRKAISFVFNFLRRA